MILFITLPKKNLHKILNMRVAFFLREKYIMLVEIQTCEALQLNRAWFKIKIKTEYCKYCSHLIAKLLCLFSSWKRLWINVSMSQYTCWQDKQVPFIFQVSWTATVWSLDRAGTRKTCVNVMWGVMSGFMFDFALYNSELELLWLNLKHSLDRRHLDGIYW